MVVASASLSAGSGGQQPRDRPCAHSGIDDAESFSLAHGGGGNPGSGFDVHEISMPKLVLGIVGGILGTVVLVSVGGVVFLVAGAAVGGFVLYQRLFGRGSKLRGGEGGPLKERWQRGDMSTAEDAAKVASVLGKMVLEPAVRAATKRTRRAVTTVSAAHELLKQRVSSSRAVRASLGGGLDLGPIQHMEETMTSVEVNGELQQREALTLLAAVLSSHGEVLGTASLQASVLAADGDDGGIMGRLRSVMGESQAGDEDAGGAGRFKFQVHAVNVAVLRDGTTLDLSHEAPSVQRSDPDPEWDMEAKFGGTRSGDTRNGQGAGRARKAKQAASSFRDAEDDAAAAGGKGSVIDAEWREK